MADKKNGPQPAVAPQAPTSGKADITKREAVRRALRHFGRDGKPSEMRDWIRKEFGIEMGADHISTEKGVLLRAKRGKGKPGRKPAAPSPMAPMPTVPARAAAGNGRQSGIPLDDILSVKELVGRFGPDQLHALVDAFAR